MCVCLRVTAEEKQISEEGVCVCVRLRERVLSVWRAGGLGKHFGHFLFDLKDTVWSNKTAQLE